VVIEADRPAAETVGGPRPGAAPADRCPFARPFPAGFDACPAHQAAVFVPTDSMHHPLRAQLTCRHLTTGTAGAAAGRYYARCGLGTAPERMRWLALVTPARLEVMRALQSEFDAAVAEQRQALFLAKAGQVRSPESAERVAALEAAIRRFLDAATAFVAEHGERFRDVGLPTGPLLQLIEEMCWAWAHTRAIPSSRQRRPVDTIPVAFQPFLHPVTHAPWQDTTRTESPGTATLDGELVAVAEPALLDTGTLRVSRLPDRDGVSVHGEIDSGNAELLADTLEAALRGSGEQHLDVSGLLFCAVAGLRALVRTAESLPPGARLVVHGMPEHIHRAMGLVGWARVPNLLVVPAGQAA
jgi:anti-anti-sigma regulatory factor